MATIKKYNGSTWENAVVRKYGTATDTITTLPADLYADGNNATVGILGNMSQTGTPTPQNPIQPSETGERTENLFDEDAVDTTKGYVSNRYLTSNGDMSSSSLYFISEYIPVAPSTVYTFFNGNAPNLPSICFYDNNKSYIEGTAYGGVDTVTVTSPVNAKYCRVSCAISYGNVSMLNTGSTALPYQPYGYKLDISSANTTTPVYLGETQTTRKIKKLVLTGNESDWGYVGEDATRYFRLVIGNLNENIANVGVCTHYTQTAISSSTTNVGFTIINSGSQNKDYLAIRPDNAANTSLEDFKTYLQQQYAAGTPVCIWYVLATPTTGIVNEPLRKIGDYADTVSGITIPTIAGANTLSIGTTLQPSEVTATYKGWHPVQSVHEYENDQWD